MKYDPFENETPDIVTTDGTENDNEAVDKLDDTPDSNSKGV